MASREVFKKHLALGKKAEKLVKQMLEEAGFSVHKYGYEFTMPSLANRTPKIKGKAADYIRHMPDFVVVNKRGEAFFVEVKYRSANAIDIEHIFYYPNCYVILVTKDSIVAQSTRYLKRDIDGFKYINQMPPFKNIKKELVLKYVDKARRWFGNDTLFSQTATKLVEKVSNRKLEKPRVKKVQINKSARKKR